MMSNNLAVLQASNSTLSRSPVTISPSFKHALANLAGSSLLYSLHILYQSILSLCLLLQHSSIDFPSFSATIGQATREVLPTYFNCELLPINAPASSLPARP